MSVNSSSSSNDSLLHPNISSINSGVVTYIYCLTTAPSSVIFTTFITTYILLILPLCIFIIYHGLQQWMQKSSTSSAATMSHSDSFTYHMVIMELVGVAGGIISICCISTENVNVLPVGFGFGAFTWFGEMFFHVLTCVERYLAVVHPITYLSLRNERGIRIRNISIGCVWLLSFVQISLLTIIDVYMIADTFFTISSLAIISFCSLSVLCVLIRPGPGEQGGARERVDQSKQRAFYTIMVILGVLVVRFTWDTIGAAFSMIGNGANCVLLISGLWSNLPCSLVLPLLFLHRAGKLVCFKNNIQ